MRGRKERGKREESEWESETERRMWGESRRISECITGYLGELWDMNTTKYSLMNCSMDVCDGGEFVVRMTSNSFWTPSAVVEFLGILSTDQRGRSDHSGSIYCHSRESLTAHCRLLLAILGWNEVFFQGFRFL